MTTFAMGPLPAVAGCTCRICLPPPPFEDPPDDLDRACIDTVIEAGWQVTLVGGGGACSCCGGDADDGDDADDGPAFAYTVGLEHRAGHPELAISGLPPSLMQRALNTLADRVVRHVLVVHPGDVFETVLANAPVTVDRVSDAGRLGIGLGSWSSWFHRAEVDVLQVVWPTVGGVFAWQPGAPPELDEAQPPSWRVASRRLRALAPDPLWPFPAPPDAMAVVCTHVREQNEPIRFVAHTRGDHRESQWDFHCGRDHGDGIDQLRGEHLAHTVRAAPSLRLIAGLKTGHFAERDDAFSPWRRGLIPLADCVTMFR